MTTVQYAKYLRQQREHRDQVVEQFDQLKQGCNHKKVVTLCSYYEGSYSWDRDDWHPETRLCLVCGGTESGGSSQRQDFTKMINPIRRFEFGDLYGKNSKYVTSPLHPDQLFATSLPKLLAWVQANGYPV
jgi:hypothetical protein